MSDYSGDPSDLVEVLTNRDATVLQIARDMLTDSGIDCWIFDANLSRMYGPVVYPRLMVHAADVNEARERLHELGFER